MVMNERFNYILIISLDSQDIKEPLRLYGIEFGQVKLLELILTWKGNFKTSQGEGVL